MRLLINVKIGNHPYAIVFIWLCCDWQNRIHSEENTAHKKSSHFRTFRYQVDRLRAE